LTLVMHREVEWPESVEGSGCSVNDKKEHAVGDVSTRRFSSLLKAAIPEGKRRDPGTLIDSFFLPMVLAALALYLMLTSDVFLSRGNINNLLSQMVLLAIVAFGSTFVVIAGDLDLSVGAGTALVSVVAASVMNSTGSVSLGLLAGILTGLAIGMTNGLLVAVLGVPAFIATLGTLVILRGVSLLLTQGGVVAGLPDGFIRLAGGDWLGISFVVWLMIVTFAVFLFLEKQTSFALRIFAIGGNREAARLAGIHVNRVRFFVFVLSGLAAGMAGLALMVRVESGQPNGAQLLELFAVAAIVMGGTSLTGGSGSVLRTLLGVSLIVVLRNGLDIKGVGFEVQQIVIGVVFVGAASVDFVRRRLSTRALVASTRSEPLSEVQSKDEALGGGGT
jgi:ribose/xylose/arabinose/galactoside ABC-type transport system permease subunit